MGLEHHVDFVVLHLQDSLQGIFDLPWVMGVIINDGATFRTDNMPYGGIKDSGIGKEGPEYAIKEMTEEKLVVFNLA